MRAGLGGRRCPRSTAPRPSARGGALDLVARWSRRPRGSRAGSGRVRVMTAVRSLSWSLGSWVSASHRAGREAVDQAARGEDEERPAAAAPRSALPAITAPHSVLPGALHAAQRERQRVVLHRRASRPAGRRSCSTRLMKVISPSVPSAGPMQRQHDAPVDAELAAAVDARRVEQLARDRRARCTGASGRCRARPPRPGCTARAAGRSSRGSPSP